MRFSIPALVLSFSALSSATFYLAQQDTEFAIGEAKTIQWDTADFEDNLDIYVGPEDADEDDDNKGKKIANNYPNTGTFTWTPDKDDARDKAKIWGKDKKGKKSKGKKLIIIIIKKPGEIVKNPVETPPPITHILPSPVTLPPGHLPPTTTLTSIATLTSIINTHITATETVILNPPIETPKNPVETPEQPPVVVVPTTVRPPTLITGTPGIPSQNGTIVRPTATTGISPPIFTGAASVPHAKPLLAGGIMGVLALGLL